MRYVLSIKMTSETARHNRWEREKKWIATHRVNASQSDKIWEKTLMTIVYIRHVTHCICIHTAIAPLSGMGHLKPDLLSLSCSRNLTLRLFCVLDSMCWVQMLKCAILNLFDGAHSMDIHLAILQHLHTFVHKEKWPNRCYKCPTTEIGITCTIQIATQSIRYDKSTLHMHIESCSHLHKICELCEWIVKNP